MQRVEVLWIDSCREFEEWTDREDGMVPSGPAECSTCGYLFYDAPDYVTVLLNSSPDQVLQAISIPRRVVREIRYLTEDGAIKGLAA